MFMTKATNTTINKTESLHFQIESPKNMVRLLVTILFQQDTDLFKKHGHVWVHLLDTEDGEEKFQQFMEEVLPEGGTIDIPELEAIKAKAIHYLETDEQALELQADYDKFVLDSWVYFKPYHKVYGVGFAEHNEKVREILADFFDEIDDYDIDKFKRFIRENFEIGSVNTTLDNIIADAENIHRYIVLGRYAKGVQI
jgi:hypothetical protein